MRASEPVAFNKSVSFATAFSAFINVLIHSCLLLGLVVYSGAVISCSFSQRMSLYMYSTCAKQLVTIVVVNNMIDSNNFIA